MTQTSSLKNPDPIPAGLDPYHRRILIRDYARKARASPKISEMYSIHIPALRMTVYSGSLQKQKESLKKFHKLYPKYKLIAREPINQ